MSLPFKHLLESKINKDKGLRIVIVELDNEFIVYIQHLIMGDDEHYGHLQYVEDFRKYPNKYEAVRRFVFVCEGYVCEPF